MGNHLGLVGGDLIDSTSYPYLGVVDVGLDTCQAVLVNDQTVIGVCHNVLASTIEALQNVDELTVSFGCESSLPQRTCADTYSATYLAAEEQPAAVTFDDIPDGTFIESTEAFENIENGIQIDYFALQLNETVNITPARILSAEAAAALQKDIKVKAVSSSSNHTASGTISLTDPVAGDFGEEVEMTLLLQEECSNKMIEITTALNENLASAFAYEERNFLCGITDSGGLCLDSGALLVLPCGEQQDTVLGVAARDFINCGFTGYPNLFHNLADQRFRDFVQSNSISVDFVADLSASCPVEVEQSPVDLVEIDGKWTCAVELFGGQNSCDCGCGIDDPDCEYEQVNVTGDCSEEDDGFFDQTSLIIIGSSIFVVVALVIIVALLKGQRPREAKKNMGANGISI